MQDESALARVMAVVRDLRVRCDWDRVQTRDTLRPYLVEEVLELDQALAGAGPEVVREELGDMLLHLAWQLELARELGEFTPDDLAGDVERKMQRRHPHLFDLGPREPWEVMKRKERAGGVLDGLPRALPALLMAYRLQERAASVGFDWPDVTGPIAKVREETGEVESALMLEDREAVADEIGDLLFAVVNVARKAGIEPRSALERANEKFRTRFATVEATAAQRGLSLDAMSLADLDRLWDEAKER